MSLPTINLINHNLALEGVLAQLGQDDRPDDPIDTTSSDDTKANNAVKVVRQSFVDAVTVTRRDERCDDEVDVAEEEEDGDRQGCLDRGIPVVLLLVEVEPGQTGSDKDIDDGQRVGNDARKD